MNAENIRHLSEKENFYYILLEFIKKNNFKGLSGFYRFIPLDRNEWNKIARGNIPDKRIVLIILVILKVNLYEAEYLMNLAGYSFQENNRTDAVILYIIKNGFFKNIDTDETLTELNNILESFGEKHISFLHNKRGVKNEH